MCLFCEIIDGKIPSTKVYEDDMILAFKDINPVAPVHIVIVPKVHIDCANGVTEENSKYVAHIFEKYLKSQKAKELTLIELSTIAVKMQVKALCISTSTL